MDEGDLRTLDALLPANAGERRTLADIILAKLESGEGEEEQTTMIQKTHRGMCLDGPRDQNMLTQMYCIDPGQPPDPAAGLNPKVVELYTKCVTVHAIVGQYILTPSSESVLFCRDTSPDRSQNLSKSYPHCLRGRVCSLLPTLRTGHHKPVMPPHEYSYRR